MQTSNLGMKNELQRAPEKSELIRGSRTKESLFSKIKQKGPSTTEKIRQIFRTIKILPNYLFSYQDFN